MHFDQLPHSARDVYGTWTRESARRTASGSKAQRVVEDIVAETVVRVAEVPPITCLIFGFDEEEDGEVAGDRYVVLELQSPTGRLVCDVRAHLGDCRQIRAGLPIDAIRHVRGLAMVILAVLVAPHPFIILDPGTAGTAVERSLIFPPADTAFRRIARGARNCTWGGITIRLGNIRTFRIGVPAGLCVTGGNRVRPEVGGDQV